MNFSEHLEKHVQRLGIAGVLAAFAAAGDSITRRTLENWRYKQWPRPVIQRGALAILAAAKSNRPSAGNGGAAKHNRPGVAVGVSTPQPF